MSTVDEILNQALALPQSDRAAMAHALIRSLPNPPTMFRTEQDLADELQHRLNATAPDEALIDMEGTMERARQAIRRAE
jgi:putative addiction module component (TIGR02574 family)